MKLPWSDLRDLRELRGGNRFCVKCQIAGEWRSERL